MSDPKRTARRRLALLLLIFALPLIPAAIVQMLVRRSPPGEAITPLMSEAIAAMQALPKPEEEAELLVLETRFQTGQVFAIEVDRRLESEDASPTRTSRSFRLEVLESDAETARLRISPITVADGDVLGRPELIFRWDRNGFIEVEGEGPIVRDLRDELLMTHGVILPGPFENEAREYSWVAPPGLHVSPEVKALLTSAGLETGREEMPHRGGLMPAKASQGHRDYLVLGYRRFAIEDSALEKKGVYERVLRGRMSFPEGGLAPGEGEIRIREVLRFKRDAQAFDGEIDALCSQRIHLLAGDKNR